MLKSYYHITICDYFLIILIQLNELFVFTFRMSYESCIHYKFGNAKVYSSISFQGLEISLCDLKTKILNAKHMHHAPLQLTNAQNKKVYVEEKEMIPRNTSVIVIRIPPPKTNLSSKVMIYNEKEREKKEIAEKIKQSLTEVGYQQPELYKIEKSEDLAIKTMMNEATFEFDKIGKQPEKTHTSGRCYVCGQYGHQKDKCPSFNRDSNSPIPRKRPKGIPDTMLEVIPKESIDKNNMSKVLYVNSKGDYVIPIVDKQAMTKRPKITNVESPAANSVRKVPKHLQCKLCHRICTDAVKIKCCDNSFCDECIRNYLIDNDFHCPLPKCGQGEIFPDNLVPDVTLRKAVKDFRGKISVEKYNSHTNVTQPSNEKSSKIEDHDKELTTEQL